MRNLIGIILGLLFLASLANAQSSDATLTTQANVIRNETTPGGNTKGRIADMFQGLIDSKPSLLGSYSNPTWITSLAFSKITSVPTLFTGSGTTNEITYFTGTNALASLSTATYPSLTELSYVKGVTSSLQTQLNNKLSSSGTLAVANGGTGLTLLGSALQVLRVNAGGTALEYATPASGIGGSTGSTDNAILRADGTGGATVQSSAITVDDTGNVGLGLSGTSGSSRAITVVGSGSNIGISMISKGAGSLQLTGTGGVSLNGETLFTDNISISQNYSGSSLTGSVSHFAVSNSTSGSPTTGIGSGIAFRSKTSAGSNFETGATIEAVSTDLTGGSEDFDLLFNTMAGGAAPVEGFRILSTGDITIGTGISGTNRTLSASGSGSDVGFIFQPKGTGAFSIGNTSNTTSNGYVIVQNKNTAIGKYSATAADPSTLSLYRGRGTTAASIATVANADYVGDVNFTSYDGNSDVTGVVIRAIVNGSVSDNVVPTDLVFYTGSGTPTERLRVTSDGRLYGTALHNNAGSVTGASTQYVASGTYTPTLFNTTNVTASTAYACQWMRVGNVVTVSGQVDIDVTLAASAATELGMSLPIASTLTADEQVGGDGVSDAIESLSARIRADAANDRASFVFKAISVSNDTYSFTFTYLIL